MSFAAPYRSDWVVAEAPVDERMAFIRRTYLHLALAILAFVLITTGLLVSGFGVWMLKALGGSRMGWLLVLGGFVLVGSLAQTMARSDASQTTQYAGLALYTVVESIIFAPLLTIAYLAAPGAIQSAAVVTLLTFAGLSAFVLTTKKDFSFLRTGLIVAGFIALGAIICGAIFGFSLGIWFSAAMILFACGSILYTTSQVLHNYHTDQHVGAALELFAAVALLFWYVLRLFLALRRE